MTTSDKTTLVLGGTGKTGSRVARKLHELGHGVRTAARHGGDVGFDWDDPATHEGALSGVALVYLVAPVLRVDFAPQVSAFLDLAESRGVRHVTYLSAYGMEHAPSEIALRAVELDLMGRSRFTHSIVRPAWFMQNFSETFLQPVGGAITVPTATGTEAFVDVEDVAAVAAATLAGPTGHAGAQYAPTGPEALSVAEAADIISGATGLAIKHVDIDRSVWLEATVAAGIPAEYGEVLRLLTEAVASSRGSTPNGDVLAVTGVHPIHFADFAERTSSAWVPGAPA
jgi:uncharacterized protein YbjT (DUF2867 family)